MWSGCGCGDGVARVEDEAELAKVGVAVPEEAAAAAERRWSKSSSRSASLSSMRVGSRRSIVPLVIESFVGSPRSSGQFIEGPPDPDIFHSTITPPPPDPKKKL